MGICTVCVWYARAYGVCVRVCVRVRVCMKRMHKHMNQVADKHGNTSIANVASAWVLRQLGEMYRYMDIHTDI